MPNVTAESHNLDGRRHLPEFVQVLRRKIEAAAEHRPRRNRERARQQLTAECVPELTSRWRRI